jgi:hypothetical protein
MAASTLDQEEEVWGRVTLFQRSESKCSNDHGPKKLTGLEKGF